MTRTKIKVHDPGWSLPFYKNGLFAPFFLIPRRWTHHLSGFLSFFRPSYPLSSEAQMRERVLMQRSQALTKMIFLSLMAGIAFILQKLEFPLPGFPTFLKIDFSEVPALIAGLLYGPLAGVLVEFFKNFLHFLFSGSETGIIPVGQLSNFLAGSVFVAVTSIIARKVGELKGLIYGLATATVISAVVMTSANWYVFFPLYSKLIHWTVTGSQKFALIMFGIAPFNLLKGVLVTAIFIPLYLKLQPHLKRRLSF
jgi:riboflavin transporter